MNQLKVRKPWLVILVVAVVSVALVACSKNTPTNNSTTNAGNSTPESSKNADLLSHWSDEFILTFGGNTYTVTQNKTNEIDQVIGNTSYHGSHSGFFKLYSIKDIENYDKIAVETKDGYLIANKNNGET